VWCGEQPRIASITTALIVHSSKRVVALLCLSRCGSYKLTEGASYAVHNGRRHITMAMQVHDNVLTDVCCAATLGACLATLLTGCWCRRG
jgi:hypothetical protein